MKRSSVTPILLTLRAAVLLLAAGFVAANARSYLVSRLGWNVSPVIYTSIAFVFILFVLWISTRRILSELKTDAPAAQTLVTDISHSSGEQVNGLIYRYPRRFGYLLTVLLAVIFFLPFMGATAGQSPALATYLLTSGIFGIVAVYALYVVKYKVVITLDSIIIESFFKRKYLLSDILKVDVVRGKNGLWALASLKSGKSIRLNGMLSNFANLVEALKAQISGNAG